MQFSVIVNCKKGETHLLWVQSSYFFAIHCVCWKREQKFLGRFIGLLDKTSTFYSCDVSFAKFVCIACNVPCIRVLVKLRYVSSFPDTFQPNLSRDFSFYVQQTRFWFCWTSNKQQTNLFHWNTLQSKHVSCNTFEVLLKQLFSLKYIAQQTCVHSLKTGGYGIRHTVP